ncbi:MAG: hypothetical protein OK452_07765 [Thaumarchaeota archaeon]|nr:hypothetical protein [Nitrososphaerota archaeon]
MTTKFEKTGQTKAHLAKATQYYLHPENRPKVHPNFVKDSKVLSSEGDTMTIEEHTHIMGRNLRAVSKMTLNRATNTFDIQLLEGDGKGSTITIALKAVPTGTEMHYAANMELGALGFIAKSPARKTFENTVDEDAKAMDALP